MKLLSRIIVPFGAVILGIAAFAPAAFAGSSTVPLPAQPAAAMVETQSSGGLTGYGKCLTTNGLPSARSASIDLSNIGGSSGYNNHTDVSSGFCGPTPIW
jgi:hypothetical protein